jgi:hypothetical protein
MFGILIPTISPNQSCVKEDKGYQLVNSKALTLVKLITLLTNLLLKTKRYMDILTSLSNHDPNSIEMRSQQLQEKQSKELSQSSIRKVKLYL